MAIKIYIDQGHNPQNPNAGAEGNGYREQDITYAVGIELARLLTNNGNFEVRLSRPTADTQLGTSNATSLAARVNGANSFGADLFVSIHANASDVTTARGSEAYVYRIPSSAADAAQDIINSLAEITGIPARGVYARPSLYVLRRTTMPAVLVELGFITTKTEADLMASRPDLYAAGIYFGILRYFGLG